MAESSGGSSAVPFAANAGTKFSKKSFEFKMCKKVAELTQVVHMLFVKNHEREVELEALRAAYEREIGDVTADARGRLDGLGRSLTEERRRGDGLRRGLERDAEEKEKDFLQRLASSEVRARELERDRDLAREQAARLQRLADEARSSQEDQRRDESDGELREHRERLASARAALEERTAELARYREAAGRQTDQRRENDAIVGRLRGEMEQVQVELTLQLEGLKTELLETSNGRERLQQRNKNLELDVRNLRKELEGRRQAEVNAQPANENMDTSEELERLRREVRLYRMELSNREGNFNRMFTDSSPIRVDHRAGGLAATRARMETRMETIQAGRPQMDSQLAVGNRTPRDVSNNPQAQLRPGLSRLPTLSMDSRQRATNSRSGRTNNNRLVATPRDRQTAGYPTPGFH